ncbi:MAG TPA: SAM-dependent methyltransferase [Deltaproteobacteria bacterium]|nr:SAM-dependent methyltransferase [Deltaproteobacteria bacterium]
MPDSIGPDETLDVLCGEKLRLVQRKKGYRFSIDSLFLANFVHLNRHERLLDVGTGCGIIPIYLSIMGYGNPLVGIEIQECLFDLAVRNQLLNGCDNVQFVRGDVNSFRFPHGFHAVVSNPPYVRESTGRKSPTAERLLARHESLLKLPALLGAASSSLLGKKGRLYIIYPVSRLAEVLAESRARGLEPRRLRFIHSREGERARLFLLECMREGGVEVKVEKPLYVFSGDRYTEEVQAYYR